MPWDGGASWQPLVCHNHRSNVPTRRQAGRQPTVACCSFGQRCTDGHHRSQTSDRSKRGRACHVSIRRNPATQPPRTTTHRYSATGGRCMGAGAQPPRIGATSTLLTRTTHSACSHSARMSLISLGLLIPLPSSTTIRSSCPASPDRPCPWATALPLSRRSLLAPAGA